MKILTLGALMVGGLFAQSQNDDPGVNVREGSALQHRTAVHRPIGVQTQGTVQIEAALNARGEVVDARVISGPEELRKPALTSVLDWHYMAGPSRVSIAIEFSEVSANMIRSSGPAPRNGVVAAQVGGRGGAPQQSSNVQLTRIIFNGVSDEAKRELSRHLPVHEGDMVEGATIGQTVATVVNEYDSHLVVMPTYTGQVNTLQLVLMINAPGWSGPTPTLTSTNEFPPAVPGSQRIRIGGNVQSANIAVKTTPSYPALAKQARVQGVVRLNALIGPDGAIKDLIVDSGHPLLVPAALEAVKQWSYKPTLLNGRPVEVVTTIDVNFTLAQ